MDQDQQRDYAEEQWQRWFSCGGRNGGRFTVTPEPAS